MAYINFDPKGDLLAQKKAIEIQIASLDACEPIDMASEGYEEWANEHEELEDLLDEIMDLLDEVE